ncbi:hypothetical protein ACFWUP_05145 [Nocardia sp. NPDC058658]|uniref:hypothetical protein n=1 Tax=Nocardia sp. NPDC058658 TaxID=3346580 RepID=UPI003649EB6B
MPESTTDEPQPSTPSKSITAWTVGLWCVSAVAGGVIVSGLLHDPEPELTTAPPSSLRVTTPPPVTHTYRTPPIVYPTQIPGCDKVEPPVAEGGFATWGSSSEFGYDNPSFPWFSGPKAVAMSNALRTALPSGVVVEWASFDRSLFFQPILGDAEQPFAGTTSAQASIRRGDQTGSLSVSVRKSGAAIPPCVAGQLDERRVLADGTTVDLQDTWSETDDVRTTSRVAIAYSPDGDVVSVYGTDAPSAGGRPSGTVPMTRDEMVALATTPAVRATAPVPAGTPTPPESCSAPVDQPDPIPEMTAKRLNTVLAGVRLDGTTFDYPLGDLRLGEFNDGGLCQTVHATNDGGTSRLAISLVTGQALSAESTTPSRDGVRITSRTLPDGAVVETQELELTVMSQPPQVESTRTVIVTNTSGTQVRVTSTATAPTEPLPFSQLETIALTPGLDVVS